MTRAGIRIHQRSDRNCLPAGHGTTEDGLLPLLATSIPVVKIAYFVCPLICHFFFFFFYRTLRSNPFPSISGLEACHRRSRDQYLPSLNRRIIHLSGLATEALDCDINRGLSSAIPEGHISKQSLLYCTPKGRIKPPIASLLHARWTMRSTVSRESILWNEISDLISCNGAFLLRRDLFERSYVPALTLTFTPAKGKKMEN